METVQPQEDKIEEKILNYYPTEILQVRPAYLLFILLKDGAIRRIERELYNNRRPIFK